MDFFLSPINGEIIGGHMHRSGWPYVLQELTPLFKPNAHIVFDDFLEKTICNQRIGIQHYVHSSPWVGICHYPYDTPSWYETEHLRDLPAQESWAESISNLQLCITLGDNLALWIHDNWNVPCVSLKHPTEIPTLTWSIERFYKNSQPSLIQVGWYLRNTHAIFQVEHPSFLQKAWLRSRRPIAERNHLLCEHHFENGRKNRGNVTIIEPVSNNEYDILLSQNIVFIELITSVANNTIIECIARNTPIVVNRQEGPEFYLGRDYPLFYSDFGEIERLISIDSIVAAHEYLQSLDKSWLTGITFRNNLSDECFKYFKTA